MRFLARIAGGLAMIALGSRLVAETPTSLTDKQQREFEKPIVSTICAGEAPGYPFSVERLRRVLQINKRGRAENVRVLVIDNGFLGNRVAPNESDGPSYFETANFPQEFFGVVENRGFLPFLYENDANLRPLDTGDAMNGHGTHVSGIILGGDYQMGEPKPGDNLKEPDVRRLLLENPDADQPKSWLKLRVVPIGWGPQAETRNPIERLEKSLKDSVATKIVNISLARVLTSSEYQELPSGYTALVVLAAGNATMHLRPGVMALPAQIEPDDRLLVVGSHDADGKLSHFSNYGDRVAIAAPGCQIQSWTDGASKPQALSGTSMSTAVVSFAAALVGSQWDTFLGAALRHRLIVSARFEEKLSRCQRARDVAKDPTGPQECIDHGAKLDIEAAALVSQDMIEYRICDSEGSKACPTKVEVGTLSSVPAAFLDCLEVRGGSLEYRSLTRNAAIKRVDNGKFEIVTETGNKIGAQPLRWDNCTITDTNANDPIKFTVSGLQLTGETAAPHEILITSKELVRLVTRVL